MTTSAMASADHVRSAPSDLGPAMRTTIDVYAVPGLESGYHEAWKALQDTHPEIVWTDANEGHWIAMRGEAVAEILADHERFSSRMIILPRSAGAAHSGMIPTTIDPPEHRWYRKQLNDNLSLKFVRGLEGDIRALANQLIDAFIDDGEVNFTTEFAELYPIRIFMSLLDLPQEDARQLKHLADQLTKPDPVMDYPTAMGALSDYLMPVLDARMKQPGDDLISRMVGRPFEGRQMTRDEAINLVMQIVIAGLDTVVNFLSFVMIYLARNEELRRYLVANPDRTGMAVSEFFRMYGTVTIARTVREDMDYRGVRLRKGDMIACPTVMHGIDESENTCPMQFDIDRSRPRHSTFGNGPHRCPGQELARSEVTIAVEQWLERIPDFREPEGFEPVYGGGIVGHIKTLRLAWDA